MDRPESYASRRVRLGRTLAWLLILGASIGIMCLQLDDGWQVLYVIAAVSLLGVVITALVFLQRRWRGTAVVLALLFIVYVSSYVVLSRRGFADADRYNAVGFYFFEPEETEEWRRWNFGLCVFYLPLIWIDNLIGTGRWPASEPTWRLS